MKHTYAIKIDRLEKVWDLFIDGYYHRSFSNLKEAEEERTRLEAQDLKEQEEL
jgi:hypothetical protein